MSWGLTRPGDGPIATTISMQHSSHPHPPPHHSRTLRASIVKTDLLAANTGFRVSGTKVTPNPSKYPHTSIGDHFQFVLHNSTGSYDILGADPLIYSIGFWNVDFVIGLPTSTCCSIYTQSIVCTTLKERFESLPFEMNPRRRSRWCGSMMGQEEGIQRKVIYHCRQMKLLQLHKGGRSLFRPYLECRVWWNQRVGV